MSDEQSAPKPSKDPEDSKADVRVIVVIFFTALLMAVHFISGFTFDF
jgi:hypothetical protein